MKRIIIFSAIIFTSNLCFGQKIINIIPATPKSNIDLSIITETWTPNQGYLMSKENQVLNDTIYLNVCHFSGDATSPEKYIDTFKIGELLPKNIQ